MTNYFPLALIKKVSRNLIRKTDADLSSSVLIIIFDSKDDESKDYTHQRDKYQGNDSSTESLFYLGDIHVRSSWEVSNYNFTDCNSI